jgi:competence protein ComFC
MEWLSGFLELFFPGVVCPLCGGEVELNTRGLCQGCQANLPKISGAICFVCGRPVSGRECFSCRGETYSFQLNRSWGLYRDRLREGIYRFKYGGRVELGRIFASLMAELVRNDEQFSSVDFVIAVPLHRERLRQRGYNQAELLGKYLARELGLQFSPGVLIRTKNTNPQSGLGKQKRKDNLEGVFKVEKSIMLKNRTVLLVDDIFTTGATACACADVLLRAGCKQVLLVTLAAGEYQGGKF